MYYISQLLSTITQAYYLLMSHAHNIINSNLTE